MYAQIRIVFPPFFAKAYLDITRHEIVQINRRFLHCELQIFKSTTDAITLTR